MSDSAKLRLVRCPKCENLLPELADYSVYQCGGCGTVLRAKVRNQEEEEESVCDDDRVGGLCSKSMNTVEKGRVDVSDVSDVDLKSCPDSLPMGSEKDNKLEGAEKCEQHFKSVSDSLGLEQQVNLNVRKNSVLVGSGRELDWKMGETGEMEDGVDKSIRDDNKSVRFLTSNLNDEPPNDRLDFISGVQELLRNSSNANGADKVKHLEQDRLELLRKLDELKEQLGQSCNLAHNPNQIASSNGGMNPPKSFYTPQQLLGPENCVAGPSFSNCCSGIEMPVQSFYPSMHNPNGTSHFGDHFGTQMLRRNSYQYSSAHQPYPPHQFHSGHYFDTSSNPFNHYPSNAPFHQPSCSCFQCQNRYSQAPTSVPGACYNRRFPDVPNNPSLYSHDNTYGACVTNTSIVNPTHNLRDRQVQSRWPTDFNSGSRPRRTVMASGDRNCYPIAGGAPFLTCNSCFEMLQLPKKLMMVKNQQSVRCGACSTLIKFTVVNNKLVLSNHSRSGPFPSEVDDSDDQAIRHYNSKFNRTNFSSDDYDFESLEREPVLQPIKPQEMPSFHPSSSSTSDDEDSPDLIKTTRSPPLPGSPLQSYFDYSSNHQAANRFGKGNRSSRSDQENMKLNKVTSRQNSLKDASQATEMDVSLNDYSDTVALQESKDGNKEDNQPRSNKGGESFFANIIKKGFRSNQVDDRSKNTVWVNGQPIPYRVVKKAEKRAGPIHPGKYWYDARAGFWGIMGGPCLGIIPPYIEEFEYPIPEDCAGGNTGVFVNGRELHKKDLNLLAGRGLPTSRNRSYIIEISGQVLDEDTGEELEGLGKLAPTVEKVKHGFGMKVARTAC